MENKPYPIKQERQPESPPPPVVEARGLSKVFRDFWRRPKVRALQELDLAIRPGEVFGLLGPNGSGKSTTIKLLLGLLHPTAGKITLFNSTPHDLAVRQRLGYLPELTWLHPFLNPVETLDYHGALANVPKLERRRRIEQLLTMLDLRQAARRPVGEFSKGMTRRVGLAQALIHNPELIILDEPTSGLDPLGCRKVKDLIRTLADQGRCVLMSSHLLADVADTCDHVAILHQGRRLAGGMVSELLSGDGDISFKLDHPPAEKVETMRAWLESNSGSRTTVERSMISLESFFIQTLARDGARDAASMDLCPTLAPFLEQAPPGAANSVAT